MVRNPTHHRTDWPRRSVRALAALMIWLGMAAFAGRSGPTPAAAQLAGGINLSLTPSASSVQAGQAVTFSYRVSPPAVAPPFASIGNLTISFGDGEMTNLSAAYRPGETATGTTDHVYTSAGSYTAVLAADASNGASGQTSAQVTVTGAAPRPGQGVTVTFEPGWNLIAAATGATIPGPLGTLYTFQAGDTGYEAVQNPQPGLGYWAFFSSATTMTIPSGSPQTVTKTLPAGQYIMVGNPGSRPATVSGADVVYVYDPGAGYQQTTILQPGQGAWVLSNRGGTVTISS